MVQVKSIELDGKHPRICVPLTGTTNEEIIKQALAAETSDAEIIEWRADYYKKVDSLSDVLDVLSHVRMHSKIKSFSVYVSNHRRRGTNLFHFDTI